jgi:hypothetical protein
MCHPCTLGVQVLQLDEVCRAAGVKFMAAAAAGPAGWFFADLQEHIYTPKVGSTLSLSSM